MGKFSVVSLQALGPVYKRPWGIGDRLSGVQIDLDILVEFGEGNSVVSLEALGPVYKIGWGRADRLSGVWIDLDVLVEFGQGMWCCITPSAWSSL